VVAGTNARATFEANFKRDVAQLLGGISVSRIVISRVSAGSVKVEFGVLPDTSGVPINITKVSSVFAAPGVVVAGTSTLAAVESVAVVRALLSHPSWSGSWSCACSCPEIKCDTAGR
jgi:hypothetical protein